MRETSFPEYEQHRREHEAFAAMVSRLSIRNTAIAHSLMEFLRSWIEQHTFGADHRMAEHTKEKEC